MPAKKSPMNRNKPPAKVTPRRITQVRPAGKSITTTTITNARPGTVEKGSHVRVTQTKRNSDGSRSTNEKAYMSSGTNGTGKRQTTEGSGSWRTPAPKPNAPHWTKRKKK